MDIVLTRLVTAKCYKVLAQMSIYEERPDIKTILEQAKQGLNLPPRLEIFLSVSGLFKSSQITALGEALLKTGTFPSKERGIYEIWYLDDAYLGKVPIVLQRIEEKPSQHGVKYNRCGFLHNWSHSEKPHAGLKLDTDKANVFLVNESKLRVINNLDIEVIEQGMRSKSMQVEVKLSTRLDSFKQVLTGQWELTGKIAVNNQGAQNNQEFGINIPEQVTTQLLNELGENLNFFWNQKDNRACFSDLANTKCLLDFNIRSLEISHVDTELGAFSQGSIKNLPIMPKNMETALDWQKKWLKLIYLNCHVSPDSMIYQQRVWLEHIALRCCQLPLLTGMELLKQLDGEERNHEVYWHAATCHYLIPQLTKMTLPSITFTDKQQINVNELLRQLTLNSEIEHIIYSDRHYKSKLHASNLKAISKESSVKSGVVFTTDDSINIPDGWQKKVFKNTRENHDRYYIFITVSENFIWKCSTSLDFAELTKQTAFIKGNCTFTRLRESELPEYLQSCLNNITEEVAA